ncbi:MAG: hypothetical protein OXC61_02560 [Flavobacteriaceae bacterium]|nr:hypothetical protein [Flavobacteriaceae bacterium]
MNQRGLREYLFSGANQRPPPIGGDDLDRFSLFLWNAPMASVLSRGDLMIFDPIEDGSLRGITENHGIAVPLFNSFFIKQ